MDPNQPIAVTVDVQSPQVVVYRLWFQRPGDAQWTQFATGNQEINPATFQVGPLPAGSKLRYFLLISGNPRTAYRVVVTLTQGGDVVPPVTAAGITDEDGSASDQGEVDL